MILPPFFVRRSGRKTTVEKKPPMSYNSEDEGEYERGFASQKKGGAMEFQYEPGLTEWWKDAIIYQI